MDRLGSYFGTYFLFEYHKLDNSFYLPLKQEHKYILYHFLDLGILIFFPFSSVFSFIDFIFCILY